MKKLIFILLPAVLLAVGCGKDEDPIKCPEGYGGTNCQTEIPPALVFIKSISLQISTTGWDVLDNPLPEPFIVIKNSGTGQELARSTPGTNTNSHTWSGSVSLLHTDTVIFEVYDYDSTTASDLIATFSLKPYQAGNDFKDLYSTTGNGVTIHVGVTYLH